MQTTLRTLTFVLALAFALPAAAQPQIPPPPECKDLPNGGNVLIAGPDIVVPVGCQSCVLGIGMPANWVIGFSSNNHNTCEFKYPNGDNSGECRKDTVCPPGTSRVSQGGVMVCTKAGPKIPFTCPALPKVDPPKVTTPAAVEQCIARLKQAEAQIVANAKTFATTVKTTDLGGGATPGSIGGATMQAAAAFTLAGMMFYGEVVPTMLVAKGACDNVDQKNAQATTDCRVATQAKQSAFQRMDGVAYKFKDATRVADRELGEAGRAANTNVKTTAETITRSFLTGQQALDACIAEAAKILPGRR